MWLPKRRVVRKKAANSDQGWREAGSAMSVKTSATTFLAWRPVTGGHAWPTFASKNFTRILLLNGGNRNKLRFIGCQYRIIEFEHADYSFISFCHSSICTNCGYCFIIRCCGGVLVLIINYNFFIASTSSLPILFFVGEDDAVIL